MKSELYEKSKASAEKILGKDAKVPDLPAAIEKALDDWKKANDEFDKSREDLEAKLVNIQNVNDALKNLGKQFGAKVAKDEFNLDSSSKDDAKKIGQAQKILGDYVSHGLKQCADYDKTLDELDKHVIQLGKYKAGKHAI